MPNPLYIATTINTDIERLWHRTQDPDQHERWDLRFSTIEYLPKPDETSPQRFRYATRLGFGLRVEGWGESVATREQDLTRTSSLKFGSDSPISIISEGSGYWKYTPNPDTNTVAFETGYDYKARHGLLGRIFDKLIFRPMIGWATAWSFDRLRLWLERDIDPALSATRALVHTAARSGLAAVFFYHGLVPKLIARHAKELELIKGSGVPDHLATPMLTVAGVLEVLFAAALLILWTKRWLYALTAFLLIALLLPALIASPALISDPFSPMTLTAALLALCAAGWVACQDLPSARRCVRRKPPTRKESAE